MDIWLAKAIVAPPSTAASCCHRQPPSHWRKQMRDLRHMSLPSNLLPGRRGRHWWQRQFDPVVQLNSINCKGRNDNDDNNNAATTTMPLVAVTILFDAQSNNQQTKGENKWGDDNGNDRWWRPALVCLYTIVEGDGCNNNASATRTARRNNQQMMGMNGCEDGVDGVVKAWVGHKVTFLTPP